MSKRYEKIAFKQTIQREWLDRTVQMMLTGLSEKEIRSELDEYLSTQKPSGGIGERGKKTYGMAISLLASWFLPDEDLVGFRDDALQLARELPSSDWLPLHWAVVSASYPFLFNVARQVGRLFNLQDQITQAQVFGRLKEQYGDRETVARNARYAVRTLIAWDVLRDSDVKGCYVKADPITISDPSISSLLLEAALWTFPDGRGDLSGLLSQPAFFPFEISPISGGLLSQKSRRINVMRYGLDDEVLTLGKV